MLNLCARGVIAYLVSMLRCCASFPCARVPCLSRGGALVGRRIVEDTAREATDLVYSTDDTWPIPILIWIRQCHRVSLTDYLTSPQAVLRDIPNVFVHWQRFDVLILCFRH
jgi:hypothetical protein